MVNLNTIRRVEDVWTQQSVVSSADPKADIMERGFVKIIFGTEALNRIHRYTHNA